MFTQLLDVFAFLSVLLRGAALALNALMLGGVAFALVILKPLAGHSQTEAAWGPCRRLIFWSSAALVATQLCYVAADSIMLAGTAGMPLRDIAGANFFIAGIAGLVAAATIAAMTISSTWRPSAALLAPSAVALAAVVMTSHAAGRLAHRPELLALTAIHQAATAAWVGGMPYLLLALARSDGADSAQVLCRRFSRMAVIGVIVLAATGAGMSLAYIGSPSAIYGTSYGAMVASKVILLLLLLLLGGMNFLIVRRQSAAYRWLFPSLRRLAEAEVGIGFTVILAAASLTSQPPATDLQYGRVTASEIAARMSPRWPSLVTPDLSALSPATPLGFGNAVQPSGLQSFVPGASYHPNTPADIAWSEYNHHWAGLIVLTAGLLAVLARSGVAGWARHWPLSFLGLAVFLFLRSDPENWPLGPRSFWQSFAVAEVLQHRVFVVMVAAFAGFEWGVRNGKIASRWASLVFPAVCAGGGALLLTHAHALGNIREELLAELSHIPLALLAVMAGWSRWLELRLTNGQHRIPACIWPVCFVLIGIVLLNYRES